MELWNRLLGKEGEKPEGQQDEKPESLPCEVSDALSPEVPESRTGERAERYKRIRGVGRELTGKMMNHLPRFVLLSAADDLNMKRGRTIVAGQEGDSAFLMDRCFYDVYWGDQNRNLIGHFGDSQDYHGLSDEERAIVQGMGAAYYSLFRITGVNQLELTVGLEDLLGGKMYTITDTNLSFTAREGYLLATRIECVDGISMTPGAACPFESHQADILLNGLKPRETTLARRGKARKVYKEIRRSDYSAYFYKQYRKISRIGYVPEEKFGVGGEGK